VRYGGDEFAAVLIDSDKGMARRRTGNFTGTKQQRIDGLFRLRDEVYAAKEPGVDTIERARHPLRDSFSH